MYCFKCGKQIRDDAVFCRYCGANQNNTANSVTISQPNVVRTSSNRGELDREALKIYLHDVLSLECIKAYYERKIRDYTYKIGEARKCKPYVKRYEIVPNNRNIPIMSKEYNKADNDFYFRYDGTLCFLGWDGRGGPCADLDDDPTWWRVDKDSDIDYLKKINENNWKYYAEYSAGYFKKREQWERARDAFFKAYTEFKSEAKTIYDNTLVTNAKNIDNWQHRIKGMTKGLEEIKTILTKAYAINIIPSQFRHKIHAIYYLHDFVSTSRESLTTALLHFDLDEIKTKLDKIISQQESIIIQNALTIAQNEKLSKQNQQQLEHLSRIESNTSQAAQYAQIAANNAETCAWISMANYIEKHG